MNSETNKYMIKKYELLLTFIFIFLTYLSINLKILVGIFLVLIFVIKNRVRLPYDTIYFPTFLVLLIGSVAGIINGQLFYNFIRDFSYFIGPLIYLLLGLFMYNELKYKPSIFRIFILYVCMDTFRVFLNLFLFQRDVLTSGSFNSVRMVILGGEIVVPLALSLILFKDYFKDGILFSKKVNISLAVMLGIRLLMSFSRTMIISFLVTAFIFWFCRLDKKSVKPKQLGLLLLLITFGFLIIRFLPDNMFSRLIDKFQRIFTETSSSGNWNSYESVVNNWRGYETHVAKQLFYAGSTVQKIFGYGFGQLFPVMYSDLVGVPLSDGGITIIHNGYFFNLIKDGLLGLGMYILFFLSIIIRSLKARAKNSVVIPFLFSYSLLVLITTSVIMGFFQRNFDAGLIIIVSMAIAYQRKVQKERST